MKKLLFALCALLALGACSTTTNESVSDSETIAQYGDALELLDAIWAEMPDKPEVVGGFGSDIVEGEPGKLNTQDESIAMSFQIPEEVLFESISAASVQHAFLANNFTAVVLEFSNGTDLKEIASQINEYASTAQWICSIPQKYLIATDENYLVFTYGSEELTADFMASVERVLPGIETQYDEAVV